MKYLLKENERITERAKTLLGKCVDKVFVGIDTYDDVDEAKNDLNIYEKQYMRESKKENEKIRLDGIEIFMKMTNGKLLHFHVSEWAFITDTKNYEIEYIEK